MVALGTYLDTAMLDCLQVIPCHNRAAALRLERLAALERAARRVREVAGELEVVLGEDAFLAHEHDDEVLLDSHGALG